MKYLLLTNFYSYATVLYDDNNNESDAIILVNWFAIQLSYFDFENFE